MSRPYYLDCGCAIKDGERYWCPSCNSPKQAPATKYHEPRLTQEEVDAIKNAMDGRKIPLKPESLTAELVEAIEHYFKYNKDSRNLGFAESKLKTALSRAKKEREQ